MQCQPTVSIDWSPNNVPGGLYRKLFFQRRKGLKSGETLPRLACEAASVRVETDNLQSYRSVIECPVADGHVPLFYPHALFGSAHLMMIAHAQFPLSASGLLHLRNHVIQRRALDSTQAWDMTCELRRQRQVEKGLEFDFDSQVSIAGEVVWQSVSTYLKRSKSSEDIEMEESSLADIFPPLDSTVEHAGGFNVPKDIGKRYAKVTGDYNPIHVSSLAAKLFGFQRAIAHGMWSVARALPELAPASGAVRHDVAFKGPMLVASRANLKKGAGGRFDIFCGKNTRPVIVGICREATDGETLG